MPLTTVQIQKAAPLDKPYKLFDGGGLYLLVQPNASKAWRLKYRFGGKEKLLSLGRLEDVSLKQARVKRESAHNLISAGTDPSDVRKAQAKAEAVREEAVELAAAGAALPGTFEAVAREWHRRIHSVKVSAGHAARTMIRFEQDVFPWIGRMPIGDVSPPVLLEVLRRVERRGAYETTHRIKDSCGQVFRYGIACGLCERDSARDLRDALVPVKETHMATITEPEKVGRLLRAIDGYKGLPVTRAALALAPLVFQRPGNLRTMEWGEVDFENAEWTIPALKMKRTVQDKVTGAPHLVPLSRQAMAILEDLHPLTGHGKYVFPSVRGSVRPMSDMTLNAALKGLGFDTKTDITAHGFRAMARTMLAERLGLNESVIEAQLAHAVKDGLGRAYNRTTFADQRREMMQSWADYLDALRQQTESPQSEFVPSASTRSTHSRAASRATATKDLSWPTLTA